MRHVKQPPVFCNDNAAVQAQFCVEAEVSSML